MKKKIKKKIQQNIELNFISNDEIWKEISINNNYEASSFGRIRHIAKKKYFSII